MTRPAIAFLVNKVRQFMQNPLNTHLKAVKRILRYLVGTQEFDLNLQKPQDMKVTAFVDANWAAYPDDNRLVSGHRVYMGRNLASWSSKKQVTVSRS